MSEAPERIWAVNFVEKSNERDAQGKYWHNPVNAGAEYVRADLYEQVKREWDGLKAENRKLRNLISATHKNPVKHENCRRHYCPICEGGLFQCADCGAVEIETEERVCTAAERLAGARVVTDAMVAAFQDKYREFWKGSWPDTETSRELLRAALAEPAGEFDKILSDSSEFVASLSDSMRATGRSVFNPPKPAGDAEPLSAQIERLASFIMEQVPGEPSKSEGAVDCAIRIIRNSLTTPPDASATREAHQAKIFTYANQPTDNVDAWRIGEACSEAAADPKCGDYIDRGLILLRELQAKGFGIARAALAGAKP